MKISDTAPFLKQPPILPTPTFLRGKSEPHFFLTFQKLNTPLPL